MNNKVRVSGGRGRVLLGFLIAGIMVLGVSTAAQAAGVSPSAMLFGGPGVTVIDPPDPNVIGPTLPANPNNPTDPGITLNIGGLDKGPSTSVLVFIGITLLSVAPSLLLMMSSFTKIFITLSMTRNAVGLQGVPPNQVIAGLALFLTFFIMAPVISQLWEVAVKPYVDQQVKFGEAMQLAEPVMRNFMAAHTREEDIALMTRAAGRVNPQNLADLPFTTLVPSFMISEVRAAFIIGFVIYVPFLVIDLVVAASLMSMGMMMLPPVMISLPFKVLLFVLVDGWGLMTQTLIGTYQ
ncbi:MAG: flagellar type III secretion system pore protein FliP [Actinomycetaceae bacterium]|nr:flagellar type III secretion system pore protein FliP [Actinomycetaceae bacterium]